MSAEISLIWGSPGTGKTTELARWSQRAVARYGSDRVVICSLTRAGAKEIARHVDLADWQVGTVHKLAYQGLGFPEIAEGKLKEWNEAYPRWNRNRQKSLDTPFDRHHEPEYTWQKSGDDLAQELSRLRTAQVQQTAWTAELRAYAAAWNDWKQQCGYLDFADLLETAYADMEKAPGDPAVILVDEVQDVGSLEMALIRKWAEYADHLVFAGDGHQAIFDFRGSSTKVITDLLDSGITPHVLKQSYRVPEAVHEVARRWMRRTGVQKVEYNPRRFELCVYCQKPLQSEYCRGCKRQVSAHGTVQQICATYAQIEPIIPDIVGYTEQGKTVMLLATCNFMLDPIIKVLQKAGIPYYNPWRPDNGKWNPLATRRGAVMLQERVIAFSRASQLVWGDEARFWTVKEFKDWVKALPAEGVFQRGQKTAAERCGDITDVELAKKLRDWFTAEAFKHVVSADVAWYMDAVEGGKIAKPYIERIVQKNGVKALQEKPRVFVGTVHALKGSEASVVYVFPDIAPSAYYGNKAAHEELARVFYVAVTRAQETLYLMAPTSHVAVGW